MQLWIEFTAIEEYCVYTILSASNSSRDSSCDGRNVMIGDVAYTTRTGNFSKALNATWDDSAVGHELIGGIDDNDEVENYRSSSSSGDEAGAADLQVTQVLELEVFPPPAEAKDNDANDNLDPDQNFYKHPLWSSDYTTLEVLEKNLSTAEKKNTSLTLLHINCRSVAHKTDQINEIATKTEADLIALTETWLDENLLDTIHLPDYKFIGRARDGGRGGGIGFFIKNSLDYQRLELGGVGGREDIFESLFIRLNLRNTTPVIGVIYRPPGLALDVFTAEFDHLLSTLKTKSKDIILLGDYNIDLLRINDHKNTSLYYNALIAHHYLPTITKPTRITTTTKTLIDNILTTAWSKLNWASIIISDISDHLPIIAEFSFESNLTSKAIFNDRRIITSNGLHKFTETLKDESWDLVAEHSLQGRTNEAYDCFFQKYKSAYNNAFPLQENRITKNNKLRNPWMTMGLLKSTRKKNRLYIKYLKNPTQVNKTKFTIYRNKFKTLRIAAERNYYTEEFLKHHNDLKSTWKLIRSALQLDNKRITVDSLLIHNVTIDNSELIANKFNEYFINIPRDLANKLPQATTTFGDYLPASTSSSMGLLPASEEELLNIGRTIKKTHTKGLDDIDPYIALSNLHLITYPIMLFINSSLSYGIVPDQLKSAKVIPVFKKGDKQNCENYRPISILPFFAKFLEKIMHDRLSSFINKTKALHPSQHGFRSGHSTFMALIDMEDKISYALDNNEYAVGIFIDVAKAFDSVNHDILIKKMNNFGIRGISNKWFRSYLESRTQTVCCNGAYSQPGIISSGVPQGSNLGPLLFLLYINDLAQISTSLYFVLFADDTSIFQSGTSWTTLVECINAELNKVNDWFVANKLTLNINKTNYIVFKSYRKIKPAIGDLSINSEPITKVDSVKFLGVFIDRHLSWRDHINYISLKIAKNIGIISRVAKILPKNIRLSLYNSLILPYLSYANLIWASNYVSPLQRLVILQKRAVRMIVGASRTEHSQPIFKDLNLLNLKQINTLQIALLLYSYSHNLLPASFEGYFTLNSKIHEHYTRGAELYRPIKTRTNMRKFSIKSAGPRIWNSIPVEIRNAKNKFIFKKSLKIFLLNN